MFRVESDLWTFSEAYLREICWTVLRRERASARVLFLNTMDILFGQYKAVCA